MSDAITPISSVATNPGAGIDRIPIQTLGQSDFLKLLATQMSAQDPLNPQSDTQFVAQMAQFSSLEQTKSIESDLTNLRSDQQLAQASALLGKSVSVQVDSGAVVQGNVSAVQIEAGTPKLIVNGQKFDLDQVTTITPAQS